MATPRPRIAILIVAAFSSRLSRYILGDFLKLNYIVDSKAQGTLTIQTNHPLSRAAVLPIFEQALRLNGLAIVQSNNTYRVVASADASRLSGTPTEAAGARPLGFGVTLVPLQYVGAADLERLLEPIVPAGSILRVDPTRNLLIVGGTEQERASVLDTISLFDTDWLSGMSFALFTPRTTEARELARELGQIIGGRDSPLAGVVRLVTIDRLNSVLAISPQEKYLEQMRGWVERLDRPSDTDEQR
jgi:general secretion pathway protein D